MRLLTKLSPRELHIKANQIRKDLVEVCVRNEAGHIAPSLSCVDILTILYYNIMNIYDYPECPDRDRIVFSKAHGCYGLYSILADIGYLDRKDWVDFYNGSNLSGCSERSLVHGIEAGCGSLGHGLPIAVGIAFGAKLQKREFMVYCLVGDGELQEGSNWEAIQFAVKHELTNFVLIVDCNKLQAMDFLENIMSKQDVVTDLSKKIEAFGFNIETCNGHDHLELCSTFTRVIEKGTASAKPKAILAQTTKGFGLYCMENVPKFHFRVPTLEDLEMGCRYGF